MDKPTKKTASQILNEAADLLEKPGKWAKGTFFISKPNGWCACAHGAIGYCGDQKVKASIQTGQLSEAETTVIDITDIVVPRRLETLNKTAQEEHLTIEQYVNKHYGQVGLAHLKARQAGLTFTFNDRATTKQHHVVAKLRKAAQL